MHKIQELLFSNIKQTVDLRHVASGHGNKCALQHPQKNTFNCYLLRLSERKSPYQQVVVVCIHLLKWATTLSHNT